MRILKESSHAATRPTALALGFFDGVHVGHRAVIGAALSCAAEGLIPAVFTFGLHGAAPDGKASAPLLQSPRLKAETLRDLGVRYLYRPEFASIRDMTPEQFIEEVVLHKLRARVVCCGADFRFGKGALGTAGTLRRLLEPEGVQVSVVPDVMVDGAPVSSTRVRDAVAAGDMALAARLLGRPFAIDFSVEHGRRLGRTLGLPTANQRFDGRMAQPRRGVYVTRVTVGGRRYPAVSNVGIRPTVGSDGVLCETYIRGFSQSIYGARIITEFVRFLRDEQKFSSVEELRLAILRDAELAFAEEV